MVVILVAAALADTEEEDKEMTTHTTETPKATPRLPSLPVGAPITSGSINISTPVGKDEEGKAVFAHVRFDAALRKEFVSGLKKYLDYLETTLN
jgi:hypothetical protein